MCKHYFHVIIAPGPRLQSLTKNMLCNVAVIHPDSISCLSPASHYLPMMSTLSGKTWCMKLVLNVLLKSSSFWCSLFDTEVEFITVSLKLFGVKFIMESMPKTNSYDNVLQLTLWCWIERQKSFYPKSWPSFSGALRTVRMHLMRQIYHVLIAISGLQEQAQL